MATPRAASTILLLSDVLGASTFRLLMIKRHSKARFMASTYVFPGGCVDEADIQIAKEQLPASLVLADYRATAIRELQEETGCSIQDDGSVAIAADNYGPWNARAAQYLVPYAHWVTPKQEGKYRYDTRFFFAKAQPEATALPIRGDPKEVADLKWVTPSEAMALHEKEDSGFRLPPPTYVIMNYLSGFSSADALIHLYRDRYATGVEAMPRVEPVLDLSKKPVHIFMRPGWIHLAPGTHKMGPGIVHVQEELPDIPAGDASPSKL